MINSQDFDSRAKERTAAFTSQLGTFETEMLTQPKNLELLVNLPGVWADIAHQREPLKLIILDMDSSVSPTYGNWEVSLITDALSAPCFHPLFCFNQYGDIE